MIASKSTSSRKSALASAITLAIGIGSQSMEAHADIFQFSYSGWFTMLDPTGSYVTNTSQPFYSNSFSGARSEISGTLSFDTVTGTGSGTMMPFNFFNQQNPPPATARNMQMRTIGNGGGGAGPLVLGNLLFDWNNNYGIPVSIVLDATGLFQYIQAGPPFINGDIITGTGVQAASATSGKSKFWLTDLMPIATTTWDTSNVPGCAPLNCLSVNPSGTLPLITDAIGGSPMQDGAFSGNNANFDLTSLTLTGFTDTTPPVLALNGASTIDLMLGDPYNDPGATCNDAVDGNLDQSIVVDGAVDTGIVGTYSVTYNCQDSSGNKAPQLTRTVNVSVAGAPVITLLGTTPVTHEAATPYNDAGATCTDPEDGDIAPLNGAFTPPQNFSSLSTVDVNVPGAYTVTYSCTDSGGISAPDAIRNVNVVDTTPPTLTLDPDCTGGITVIGGPATPDPTPTATCFDTVDGDITSSIVKTGDIVNPDPDFGSSLSETYNLGYSCVDSSNNQAARSCKIVVGNPDPVATLLGNETVVVSSGADYVEEGATCADFTDGALPDATPSMIIDGSTPNGSYTITYTCTDKDNNTGTTTRNVIVGVAFSAASDSGSTFVMLDPTGSFVGGADDIFFSWDGSLYTDPATETLPNMFMGSAQPQPFFGFPWTAHNIRAFGPGDYTIPTSRGNTLKLHVAPNQIGAHMLFDWNNNNNIDVVLAWDIVGVFVGSTGVANDLGSKGQYFGLASIDADGDGLSGVPMADGPFKGFNANFNIRLEPLFALPDVTTTAEQGSNNPTTQIVSTTDAVTLSTSVNPNVNGVFTYQGPFLYDWSGSDAALLAVNTNGTTNNTFIFNPDSLPDGPVKAVVKVTDAVTGVTATKNIPLEVITGTLANAKDSDADGIPDSQDLINNDTTPTLQQAESGNGTTRLLQSSAGKLLLGTQALTSSTQSGTYQAAVADTDIGVPDANVENSCVGDCFSFKVTGLVPGSAVDVVLPLSLGMSADAAVRKFINGAWRDFVTTNGNTIMSATGSADKCPAPDEAGWVSGLTEGSFCLKLTIVDGGPNDADANANGLVEDPVGIAGGAGAVSTPPPKNVSAPNTGGGCSLANSPVPAAKRYDLWLLSAFMAWLGLNRRKRKHD